MLEKTEIIHKLVDWGYDNDNPNLWESACGVRSGRNERSIFLSNVTCEKCRELTPKLIVTDYLITVLRHIELCLIPDDAKEHLWQIKDIIYKKNVEIGYGRVEISYEKQ